MTRAEGGPLSVSGLLAKLEDDRPAAWMWAWRRLGRSDEARSEVLIRAFRHDGAALRRADPEAPAAAWLRKTARNVELEESRAEPKVVERAQDERPSVGIADVDTSSMTGKQAETVDLLAGGKNMTEVGRHLGVCRTSVRERLERGLRRSRCKPERKRRKKRDLDGRCRTKKEQDAADLYRRGFTYQEIGDRLGISRDAARGRIRRVRARGKT